MPESHPSVFSRLRDDKFCGEARWIGIVMADWTVLEAEMEGVFRVALNLDYDRSKIAYYAIQNLAARRDMISAALEEFHKNSGADMAWKQLLPDLKKGAEARNRCAHAIWAEHPKTGVLQMRTTISKGVYVRPRKRYSINNLRQSANLIASVAGRMNQVQQLLYFNSPSSS